MKKYVLGIDFGTLSARALIVDTEDGREMGTCACDYANGVMDKTLPDGTPLLQDWALQSPGDYMDALCACVNGALENAMIDKNDIIAVGIDFTASTMLPVDQSMRPLMYKYPSNPHAYVKLWKHHAAQKQANRMTEIAEAYDPDLLSAYGGKVSSEWALPKVVQMIEEDPVLYDETDRLVEAGDWIVYRLTGEYKKSAEIAGYKAFYRNDKGYPEKEYLKKVHPKLEYVFEDKLRGEVYPAGSIAGYLKSDMAEVLSLPKGIPVAVSNIDAHVSLPAAGVVQKGGMLMIMGTSACHMVLDDRMVPVDGMCGAVEDQVIERLVCYEAGQSCVGDQFNWFVNHMVPAEYEKEAVLMDMNKHEYLTYLCEKKRPGETGLIALDWMNGNRSVLVDADLTGMILGMTLSTKPEDLYRALIESTAFGTRVIVDQFESAGVQIRSISASGGISKKNAFLMQVYADVLKREIRIAKSDQASALGSAIYASVAAGSERGGYDNITEAAGRMGGTMERTFRPIPSNSAVYDRLYSEYRRLHEFFGRGGNDVMKRLKAIKKDVGR